MNFFNNLYHKVYQESNFNQQPNIIDFSQRPETFYIGAGQRIDSSNLAKKLKNSQAEIIKLADCGVDNLLISRVPIG